MSTENIEVKTRTLKLVYDSLMPVYYRLNSLLEDVVESVVVVPEPDKALLLEFCAHACTLKVLFESYFENFTESVSIPREEYALLLSIAKSVEASARASFGHLTMWVN